MSELWLSQPDSEVPQEERKTTFEVRCDWMAVEIFDGRHIGYTSKETDVWEFGMTILVGLFGPFKMCC